MGIVEAIHTTHKKPVVKPGLKPLPHLLWFPLQRAEGAQLSPTVSGCDFFSEIFYHEMDLPFLLLSLCSYQGDKWHFTAMLHSRHPRETTASTMRKQTQDRITSRALHVKVNKYKAMGGAT